MPARALTVLVAVMGIAILAGFAALGAVIAGRMGHPRPAGTATASRPFTAPAIDLPAGARVEALAAGTDRAILDLALPDGTRQLVIIELATGRRLGTVPLHPSP